MAGKAITAAGRTVWRIVSWPVRTLVGALARLFRWLGPVKAAMALLGGLCAILLLWNVLIGPALLGMVFAHMPRPVIQVAAAEARAITWTPGLEAVGTARAFQGADVAAETDGVVAVIDVAPGAHASAGQRLVQIDDSVERADLIASEANIKLMETQLARTATLTKKGVSAQASLDDARNQLDVAKSVLARTQALLDQKSVRARFDGTVGIPRVDVGQYVTTGTVLVTLQDLDRIYVDFTVPEQSASLLGLGQAVRFGATKDSYDYQGKIIGIDPKVDPQTHLMAVRAEIADANGRIRPGEFLQLRIDLPAETNVVVLPVTAVVTSLYGDYVYLLTPPEGDAAKGADAKARIARQAIVQIGRRNGQLVEIRNGLSPGQSVVAIGQNTVQNGAAVEITETVDPAKLADGGALP